MAEEASEMSGWCDEIVDFSSSSPERNVALLVDERHLYVSKEALSLYSPVFRNLFYGHFKEANQAVIPLPEKSYEEILELIKCLFPCPYVKNVCIDNVKVLLPLAEEYQIVDLKRRCELFLLSTVSGNNTNHNTSGHGHLTIVEGDFHADTLALACRFDMPVLKQELIRTVSQLPCKTIREYHDRFSLGVIAALYENKCGQCALCAHDMQVADKGRCACCDRSSEKTINCKKCRKTFCTPCVIAGNRKYTAGAASRFGAPNENCFFPFSSNLLTRKK